MCDAGIENQKKNVWLNKSIYPLNKTFLWGQKAKTHFLRKRQNPKKNVFIFCFSVPGFLMPKNQKFLHKDTTKTMPRFNPQAVAALVDSVPKPTAEQLKGHKALGYGTAGFRAPHFLLESVCLRMGMMVRDSSFQPRPTMMVSFSLL